jgi:hypothetical protein
MRKWSIRRATRLWWLSVSIVAGVAIAGAVWFSAASASSMPINAGIRPLQYALDVRSVSTSELTRISAAIALVRCRSVEAREEDGNIFTFITFDVERQVKGASTPEITLRLIGGRVGNVIVPGLADIGFRTGRQYVVFMGKPNLAGYPTISPQGVFMVRTADDGGLFVDPAPDGLPIWSAASGKPFAAAPSRVRLDDFLLSLKQLR